MEILEQFSFMGSEHLSRDNCNVKVELQIHTPAKARCNR